MDTIDTNPPSGLSTTVFIQDACLLHKYIRTKDSSRIVERPERLRAVKIGLCAAIARLEEFLPVATSADAAAPGENSEADALVEAIGNLQLEQKDSVVLPLPKGLPVQVVRSFAKVDILDHPAVKHIHGDIDGDDYLKNLVEWARQSADKISNGQCEIPDGLPQDDLYLCPTSLDAIQGALGTVCEAVDTVMKSPIPGSPEPPRAAFVVVRPPGHHCGEDSPGGFCFVNNVVVGAAHAHLNHGIRRVVILDFDLHHGNGTQSIIWQINEEAYQTRLAAEEGAPSKPGLRVYYGSLHDILSFPCEDGKPDMVQAASTSIHGAHGQYIENVHLDPFESEEQFWNVHYRAYSKLLNKAEDFVKSTGGASDDTIVFISAGFDASEHETPVMSRHNRKVPTSFFNRFTQDASSFANKWAQGRIVSVLEGGYSDQALLSGAMAHLTGLVDGGRSDPDQSREDWWSPENVQMLEKLAKNHRGGPQSSLDAADGGHPRWFDRTVALLALLDPHGPEPSSSRNTFIPPSPMTLRTRRPATPGTTPSTTTTSHPTSPNRKTASYQSHPVGEAAADALSASSPESTPSEIAPAATVAKKLPRVLLKLGPQPET